MLAELEPLFSLLTQLPASVSIAFTSVSVAVTGWLYYRRVNIEERTSVSSIQKMQVTSLLEQIEMLSADLMLARHQIRQLHEQNVQLMAELREANQRIAAMEATLDRKRFSRRWYDKNNGTGSVDGADEPTVDATSEASAEIVAAHVESLN